MTFASPNCGSGPGAAPVVALRDIGEGEELTEPAHVLDGDDHLELERLPGPRVDDRHLAVGADATEEARDGLEGTLGRREADPLERRKGGVRGSQVLEALEGEREMGAALRPREGVDLVDDHVLNRKSTRLNSSHT